jgi:hypothetical protein
MPSVAHLNLTMPLRDTIAYAGLTFAYRACAFGRQRTATE